ncbi:hypothetical protein SAMN04487968_103248 [Nocardioides terrae]|uniref:Pilus assembly protein Flp/PilA n=1 Tax=Nocardioides terrae TaxID=574651 RepID=A0A1I1G457_9ACTN|nr:Flp family type IVb pilin [Nocardioides terrae]SFC06384.1 hypothetical protein SAMN04487968_103248 [Nocardioides terrae]
MHRRSERGASAVEYGLLVSGVAGLVAVIVFSLGRVAGEQMNNDCDAITGQMNTALKSGSAPGCH